MAPQQLDEFIRNTKTDVAIQWTKQGKFLKPDIKIDTGASSYGDTSQLTKFEVGEGLVGEAFQKNEAIFVPDVLNSPSKFSRKNIALDEGLQTVAFIPYEDSIIELAFSAMNPSIPKSCPRLAPPDAGGYVLEDLGDIMASIPGIAETKHQIQTMMSEIGYVPNDGIGPDVRDNNNTDKWVPRDHRLNRLTGIHPFNCEAPLSILREHKYLTPPTLHYVRNHGICPKLFWHSHTIEIKGLVDKPVNLTMQELMTLPRISVPVTLNCAGNRRKEQNLIQKGIGFHWGCAAASTVIWTGVPLHEVLKYVGIQDEARWINFAGPMGEVPAGDTTYGASHAREVCMNPARPCMLAFMMNGELLHPDHGYPVRLLMPGYIGGRMIKWLSFMSVTKEEGDEHSHYHWYDNRVFPKHITSKEVATEEKIWKDPAYTINDRNINSAIWAPAHCAKIKISDGMFTLRGYAYAGAGRPVHRVEVTLNNAQNWRPAKIERFEKPDQYGQCWCWVFWSVEVPISALAKCGEFAVRAWDDSQNCQPERPTWNLMGMMNNPWFRVKVHSLSEDEIWFEHPTQVDNRHSIDKKAALNPQNETLHLTSNGDLASTGWMERMLKDVQAVYGPGKPEDLDAQEGWEREKMHMLPKPAEEVVTEPSCVTGLVALTDLVRKFLCK
jgi:DMSO/TMAO reductase YedYZ molybdopterin-dependent catalytic subunit